MWYEAEYSIADIGEIVEAVRTQMLHISQQAFADKLCILPNTLDLVEQGKSPKAYAVLEKIVQQGYLKANVSFKFRDEVKLL